MEVDFAAMPDASDQVGGDAIGTRFCPAVEGEKSAVAEHVTADPAARVLRGNCRKADPVFHFGGFTWLMTEGQVHCPD